MKTCILITSLAAGLTALCGPAGDYHNIAGESPLKPVVLSGDAENDFRTRAASADVCAVAPLPAANILRSWKTLGVRMLKRVTCSDETSAEFFRRTSGFLAFHEGADGVWVENFDRSSKALAWALAESGKDILTARYLDGLSEEALTNADHRIRCEGRRVKWLFANLDYKSFDLDLLRMEFIAYARFMENILGKAERPLPSRLAANPAADAENFVPSGTPVNVPLNLSGLAGGAALAPGFDFSTGRNAFTLKLSSDERFDGDFPGGAYTVRLYIPVKGKLVPYEYVVDLSPVRQPRAPAPGIGGLYFVKERFGKGRFRIYGDPENWRIRTVQHRSWGPSAPDLAPALSFRKGKDSGWTAELRFDMSRLYGAWPMTRTGVRDVWYAGVDVLPGGRPGGTFKLMWPKGREANFKEFASAVFNSGSQITGRYNEERRKSVEIYSRWHSERLFGPVRASVRTWQVFGESDRMFSERCLQPVLDSVAEIADATSEAPKGQKAKFLKYDDARKLSVWKNIGRLLNFSSSVQKARLKYLVDGFNGVEPPPYEKPKAKDAGKPSGPDISDGDDIIELDDKEF